MPRVVVVPNRVRVHLCPKVASAGLYKAFHLERRAYLDTPEAHGDEFRFVTVRHPADRLVSTWAYFCTGARTEIAGQPQFAKLGYYHGQPFGEFLDVALERHWENVHTRCQADFAGPHEADEYVPLHNLDVHWARLRYRFPDVKIMYQVPRSHPTEHAPWQTYFDAQRLSRVKEVFSADMALYAKACEQE